MRGGADERTDAMGATPAGVVSCGSVKKRSNYTHGRYKAVNTGTAESIAVPCSHPCHTVVLVSWSTFPALVDIWPRQAMSSVGPMGQRQGSPDAASAGYVMYSASWVICGGHPRK